MWIEDISTYLSTKYQPTYEDATFQYQKVATDLTINVNKNQQYVGTSIGNYAEIQQDGKSYYYFITSANWKSKECVELVLSMDTINTFQSDIKFDKKTTVKRQHKDRVKLNRAIAQLTLTNISDPNILESRVGKEIYMSKPNSLELGMLVKILKVELNGNNGSIYLGNISLFLK